MSLYKKQRKRFENPTPEDWGAATFVAGDRGNVHSTLTAAMARKTERCKITQGDPSLSLHACVVNQISRAESVHNTRGCLLGTARLQLERAEKGFPPEKSLLW